MGNRSVLIECLAREFAARLRKEIGDEELRLVNLRNLEVSNACASHDFCDANEVMLAAWNEVFADGPPRPDDGEDTCIWNEAWNIAKRERFWFTGA